MLTSSFCFRGKEQSATPLRRSSAADDRPGSKQTFLTQSRRGMFCGSFSSEQNGNVENDLRPRATTWENGKEYPDDGCFSD